MTSQQKALAKLQQYAEKVGEQPYDEPISSAEEEAYADQLQKSLQSLQNQVKEHKAELEKVRLSTGAWPSLLSWSNLAVARDNPSGIH